MIRVTWRQSAASEETWRQAYRRLTGEPWRKRDVQARWRVRGWRVVLMDNGVVILRAGAAREIQFPRGWEFPCG